MHSVPHCRRPMRVTAHCFSRAGARARSRPRAGSAARRPPARSPPRGPARPRRRSCGGRGPRSRAALRARAPGPAAALPPPPRAPACPRRTRLFCKRSRSRDGCMHGRTSRSNASSQDCVRPLCSMRVKQRLAHTQHVRHGHSHQIHAPYLLGTLPRTGLCKGPCLHAGT